MLQKYLSVLVCLPFAAIAQDAMHIHNGASMTVFGDVAVFGDVQQNGDLTSQSGTAIQFMGTNWQQDAAASHSGDGWLIMTQPNALYGTNSAQNLDGGGILASLPNVEIDNASDVFLLSTDTKVRQTLLFTQGKLFLDGNDLVLGDNSAGFIDGFDENRFIVTNGSATDTKGFLIRESVGGSIDIDFPVGLTAEEYTPARLRNSGTADEFRVRVFPEVLSDATIGTNKDASSVGRTWHIEEGMASGSDVEMWLQYTGAMEGVAYDHDQNFIARYVGQPNSVGGATSTDDLPNWDYVGGDNCNTGINGNITTGTPQSTAWFSTRAGLTDLKTYVYYAPYACQPDEEFVIPNAFSPNGDGFNETWTIDNIQLFPKRNLRVVNRWGDTVFSSKFYNNEWDGTYAKGLLPAGTYYYVLDLGEPFGIKKGPVTIVRE